METSHENSQMISVSKLTKLLEAECKGFAYKILQLEMIIDDPNQTLGSCKIQDITKLLELYVLGVQVLEAHKVKNYEYFSRKLQALMKKKIVLQELKIDSKEQGVTLSPKSSRNKRITHLQQYNKKNQIHSIQHLTQIVSNAENKIQSCKGIIVGDLQKQQDKIKQRIASRSKSKRSELQHSLERKIVHGQKRNKKSEEGNVQNQYYTNAPVINTKSSKHVSRNKQVKPLGQRSEQRQNRFDFKRH